MTPHVLPLAAVRGHLEHQAAWWHIRTLLRDATKCDIWGHRLNLAEAKISLAFRCGMKALTATRDGGDKPALSFPMQRSTDHA